MCVFKILKEQKDSLIADIHCTCTRYLQEYLYVHCIIFLEIAASALNLALWGEYVRTSPSYSQPQWIGLVVRSL